jgi:hypothetical protein
VVQATDEIRKSAAGVRQANFQLGEPIEEAAKDYFGRGDRGVKWIAQKVMQVVARQPLDSDDVQRMEKDRNSERVNALEDRQE